MRRFVNAAGFIAIGALIQFIGLSASGSQSIPVQWNPSPDPDVAGYYVYYGSSSGHYTDRIDAGNATSATVPGLIEGDTYYLTVTAHTINGLESLPSNEMAVTVPGVLYLNSHTINPVHVQFPAIPGGSYTLQASSDLKTWTAVWSTTNAASQWIDFADSNSQSFKSRFYRLVLQ